MSYSNNLQNINVKIEYTREVLNNLIASKMDKISNKEIIYVSKVLDDLLVEYLKKNINNKV
ncbi:Spo0E family sporulation regulatory protein-aspartic acid phosphatase [Defluviitalea phaphyphila]|uniref:Spo0E family sporulation regulatory protein-aspartic acid phosphatase n=1 Tax=Defluviitalea phaphyphila TaxID=1473580 RepID=UPI0007313C6B|nr:Spo0E family sporulation regulatory protein-aspartic acid phosphatase [Defluviitalea phaphyphila]